MTGNIRIPGIAINFIVSGPTRFAVGVVRSPHGFKTIPPKPELGEVIWKEKLVSGKLWKILPASSAEACVCSMVELADASTIPKTTP